ncbi:MAG: hypothetical protein KAJ88_04545 [Candidatus Aenigmarchaeota archaeon]|nr:hypothetical protein [Candidatus Aenigmarchaeota archaeon]
MKKTTVLVSLLVLLAFSGISAYAADTAPALVIKDNGCNVPDANGNLFFTPDSHIVISNDKNGNSKITCHSQLTDPETYPKKAVHWDYESYLEAHPNIPNILGECGTGAGLTKDWKAVVTPSGKVMLTCHINPNPTP